MNVHNPMGTMDSIVPPGWRFLFDTELSNPPQDAEVNNAVNSGFVRRAASPGYPCDPDLTYITKAPIPRPRFDPSNFQQFGAISAAIVAAEQSQ